MRALVTYLTRTGNTRRVAEAIFDEIAAEKEIAPFSEAARLEDCDLLFVGFPIEQFGPAQPARAFLEEKCRGRRVALFVTHAAPDGAPPLAPWLAACKAAAGGCELAGLFHCQGALAPQVAEALLESDDPQLRGFGEMAPSTLGHPDEDDLRKARAFAREMLAEA